MKRIALAFAALPTASSAYAADPFGSASPRFWAAATSPIAVNPNCSARRSPPTA